MEPSPTTSPTGNRRSLLVLGLVLVSLLVAVRGVDRDDVGAADTGAAASGATHSVTVWSLTAGDLVHGIAAQDGIVRATGGYVPGRGVFVTAEVRELASGEVDEWAHAQIDRAGPELAGLPEGEEIVFLIDIATPQRTSRLFRIDPATPNGLASMAPATSTAPMAPTFHGADDDPEDRP